jgi:hypothetical protein
MFHFDTARVRPTSIREVGAEHDGLNLTR